MKKSSQNLNEVFSSGFEGSGSDIDDLESKSTSKSCKKIEIVKSLFADKNYQGLTERTNFKEPQIDSDEEVIHILKIPREIDPMCLKNTKFSLTKKSKVRTQSEIYCIKPLSDVPEPRFFIGPDGLKKINPVSILHLEKYVKNENKREEIDEEEIKKALPTEIIKNRHPLFGEKYESRVELHEKIQQKLQQALQRFEKKKKGSKKKRNQIINNDDFDDKSLLISQILEAKFQSKKSRKSEEKMKKKSLDTTLDIQQSFFFTKIS